MVSRSISIFARAFAVAGALLLVSGCAALELPSYVANAEEQKEIEGCDTQGNSEDIDVRFCRAGREAEIAARVFEDYRRDTHGNGLALRSTLMALGVAGAGAALADVHSSTLNTLAFLTGVTTAYLSFSNPSPKHDLYTDAFDRADCLAQVSSTYLVPVREWGDARGHPLESFRINVERDKSIWQQTTPESEDLLEQQQTHTNTAIRFLTAFEEALSAAENLRKNAEEVYIYLPERLGSGLKKIKLHVERNVRTQTGSYETFLEQVRADAQSIADADQNKQTIEEQMQLLTQGRGVLEAQARNLAGRNVFSPNSYDRARTALDDVVELAPLIVAANTAITACIAGL